MTILSEFAVASELGNEVPAMRRVAEAVARLNLSPKQIERLKTAVAEATMNAIEHGNHFQADVPVEIQVGLTGTTVCVRIRDSGGGQLLAAADTPDLAAKLAGAQSPRGWGLFLISKMVDDIRISSDGAHRTIELLVRMAEGDAARQQ